MKTAVKRFISIILCISMLMGMIVVGDAYDDRTYAYIHSNVDYSNNKAYSCGVFPDASTLKTNPEADLGDADNQFVVLEIVPTYDQGTFGILFRAASRLIWRQSSGIIIRIRTIWDC